MVLNNFKSYAGTVEIGPFHKSFTSIVGPNGSGKSNVIDSLLFVFGFKAKKIRQGKLSELIHNSTNYQHLTSCSVEVHFREIIDLPGPDGFEVVPNSDLIISRTVEKGVGEKAADKSVYRINGRSSNFTEVTQLLKAKGVDLDHKRFLILQGEVESISLMKPKAPNEHEDGLLEYLEDIIGTSVYKQPIEEANASVDRLNEERGEKLNRLKIVEKDKNSLETKKKEAEEFINTENDLLRRKNAIYQMRVMQRKQETAKLEQETTALSARLAEEKAKYAELLTEIKAVEKTYNMSQRVYDDLATKAEAVRKELQKFDRAEVELKEKEKHLTAKLKKLEKALHQDKLSRSEHETWMQNFDSDLLKANQELEGLTQRLVVEDKLLDEIRESLKGKTEGFQKQIEQKQQSLAPWSDKINGKQAAIDVAESEFKILQERVESARSALTEAEAEVRTLKEAGQQKTAELAARQKHGQGLTDEAKAREKQLAKIVEKENALKEALSSARQQVDEAKASLSAAQARGKLHVSIMQQSKSGRLHGVCGRLGDLGVIDDRFDVAITTACGALQSIVVDTVESGQQCIEFLKQQNLGRATFICLDKLRQWDMSPIQTPENVPRLFDLIQPKHQKFAPAFYQALQDTLVAKDLQQANRIAFGAKRYRVVTLDGQLIDTSGTMSGGGSAPQRGGMSSKFAAADVDPQKAVELEKSREELEKELRSVSEARAKAEQELKALRDQIPPLEMEYKKLDMEVEAIGARYEDAKRNLQDLRNQNLQPDASDLQRMEELKRVIALHTHEMEKYQRSASIIEDEIKQLHEKIMEVGGVKLRVQKAKCDGINEQIEGVRGAITKLQAERTTRKKNLGKVMAGIAKKEHEGQETLGLLEGVRGELEGQMSGARDLRQRVNEAKEVMREKEDELESLKAELNQREETVNEMRKVEVDVKNQLDKAKEMLNSNLREIQNWQKAIDKFELQVTGYEEEEVEPLKRYTEEELEELNPEVLEREIAGLQAKLDKGTPNLAVLAEYKAKLDTYLSRAKDLEEITAERDGAKQTYDDLRNKRLVEFMEGFTAISQKLKEMYQMITLGGNAELELVDSLDPFSEGIIFSVMPPKKSWKNISNLSGGEKTLSSLALVFALHHFKPTPLYVMDEIDAALDFRNVSIVANYIKERTKNAQFVIISLRNNMFELADRLVGIYKTDNTTKSITINPTAVVAR
ncbi:hypothetical protein HDV00_002891 [Rhizophlyctis rosea]|nr:hypothetical protein HDV00_002891 [Rhizophlyctis rosea]